MPRISKTRINQRLVVVLFFGLLLGSGVLLFDDYGMSWDERFNALRGELYLDYFLHRDPAVLQNYIQKYFGPFPEVLMSLVTRSSGLDKDTRSLFLARHFMNFLIFYAGTVFLYLLGRRVFGDWRAGLLGSLFLILSPRFFAQGFYNVKDVSLLTAVVISMFTLHRFLENPTPVRLALHALACAVATDVRIMGCITVFLTGVAFVLILGQNRRDSKKLLRFLTSGLVFFLLWFALTVVFWPPLWKSPLSSFLHALAKASTFPWGGKVFYLGKFITDSDLPWHYLPVWIAITAPVLYVGSSILGVGACFSDLFKHSSDSLKRIFSSVILLWFFLPVLAVILGHFPAHDEYRHVFFIYPALLLLSLKGLFLIPAFLRWITGGKFLQLRRVTLPALLVVGLLPVGHFMVKNHPFEMVYFNRLAGKNLAQVAHKFEMDYWGLSYRRGLEYLLRHDSAEKIKIQVANLLPGKLNASILRPEERKRLVFVQKAEASLVVELSPGLVRFLEMNPGKYSYRESERRLVIRGRMTSQERDELRKIYPGMSEAVKKLFLSSKQVGKAKYFLTIHRLHPQDYPMEKVFSVTVGGAHILDVYRVPQETQD